MRKSKLVARRVLTGGALVSSVLFASVASAADEAPSAESTESADNAARLNEEGAAMFKAHDYRHAAEKFIRAYAIDPDPNLLFNIARCYEMMGDTEGAIEKYEEFMANPGADPQGKQRAEAAVRNLRRPKSEAPAADAQSDTGLADASQPASTPAAEPEKPGSKLGVLPWVTLGAGVVVSALGGTFYVLGDRDHTKVTDTEGYGDPSAISPMTRQEAQDLVDSGDQKKMIGGISLGLGGALLATSVVLFLVDGPKQESSDPNMAFGVAPAAGGGSVSFQGRF